LSLLQTAKIYYDTSFVEKAISDAHTHVLNIDIVSISR